MGAQTHLSSLNKDLILALIFHPWHKQPNHSTLVSHVPSLFYLQRNNASNPISYNFPNPLTILSGNHYKSDYHRYNMKRRVAGLPPVALAIFNKKVLDHKEETAIVSSTGSEFCEVCK